MRAYHYTGGHHLDAIAASGVLRPTDALLGPTERPAVWFSTNPVFEASAAKGTIGPGGIQRLLTLTEQARMIGAYRFGIDADDARLIPWPAAIDALCIDPGTGVRLVLSAKRMGANPMEWSVSPIPLGIGGLTIEWYDPVREEWTIGTMNEARRVNPWTGGRSNRGATPRSDDDPTPEPVSVQRRAAGF